MRKLSKITQLFFRIAVTKLFNILNYVSKIYLFFRMLSITTSSIQTHLLISFLSRIGHIKSQANCET